jgi:hypothetical protein
MRELLVIGMMAGLAACQERNVANSAVANEPQPAAGANHPIEMNRTNPAQSAELDPSPAGEPNGPIDPKSVEGAGQVVQKYGALIEQGRFAEANALWTDPRAAADAQAGLGQYRDVHLQIYAPSQPEGAAGSIYIEVPIEFYGKTSGGTDFQHKAEVTLRRVNDVPGSTESQRNWHIQSID